ncbi:MULTISPECIES: tetratricopeptide repeat protein [unclassified Moraxella]|uniref:tetratricopeptide repeat protein n=1 Tax=unclassified Moraxella TaxID=2685852 RepID=UPI00359DF0A2
MKISRILFTLLRALGLGVARPAMADDFATATSYLNTKNYEQAFAIFKRLAKQGLVEAQYNLGNMYRGEDGINQDYEQALSWYKKAAEQGDVQSQTIVGMLYAIGKGVNQDYVPPKSGLVKSVI